MAYSEHGYQQGLLHRNTTKCLRHHLHNPGLSLLFCFILNRGYHSLGELQQPLSEHTIDSTTLQRWTTLGNPASHWHQLKETPKIKRSRDLRSKNQVTPISPSRFQIDDMILYLMDDICPPSNLFPFLPWYDWCRPVDPAQIPNPMPVYLFFPFQSAV